MMLTSARALLGAAGQIAPVNETTARVTYAGGGFRFLDVSGFANTQTQQLPEAIDIWVRSMLLDDGDLVLPENLAPVVWATEHIPAGALTRSLGTGLVEGALLDATPVTSTHGQSWGADFASISRHARTQLAQTGIQPQQVFAHGQQLWVLTEPRRSASAWANFPNLLKSVTGINTTHVVFIPDPGTCIVVADSAADQLTAARKYCAELYDQADTPVSTKGWVRVGGELVEFTSDQ